MKIKNKVTDVVWDIEDLATLKRIKNNKNFEEVKDAKPNKTTPKNKG